MVADEDISKFIKELKEKIDSIGQYEKALESASLIHNFKTKEVLIFSQLIPKGNEREFNIFYNQIQNIQFNVKNSGPLINLPGNVVKDVLNRLLSVFDDYNYLQTLKGEGNMYTI